MVKVGLNGFGRTGRSFLRAVVERDLPVEIVAINDLASAEELARLLSRDSVHGRMDGVAVTDGRLMVGGQTMLMVHEGDPKALPWDALGVEVAVEASGRFTAADKAGAHLDAGAHRVVVSAPCKGADATIVMGVNDGDLDPARHRIISNASCTTNCLVPMVKVLDDRFGLRHGLMTTTHAYTGDQRLVDGIHKDPRRSRAAAINIVPTTTGAARATSEVIEAMAGRLDGVALRVPVADGSVTDLVAQLDGQPDAPAINAAFAAAASGALQGVLEYSEEALVSSDIVGRPASCIFDAGLTTTCGPLVKIFGWYDNEVGYANRLAELTVRVGQL